MGTIPNQNIWQFINGSWVKIKLRPGVSLYHCTVNSHDEGFERRNETFELTECGTVVENTVWTEGRDCDGRYKSSHFFVCPVERLHHITPLSPAVRLANGKSMRMPYHIDNGQRVECPRTPNWQKREDSLYYDEYAVRANY